MGWGGAAETVRYIALGTGTSVDTVSVEGEARIAATTGVVGSAACALTNVAAVA